MKILAVAGAERPETYGEALRLGTNAMLKKSMSIGELRNAVARCLVSEGMKLPLPLDCVSSRHPVERPEVISGTGLEDGRQA